MRICSRGRRKRPLDVFMGSRRNVYEGLVKCFLYNNSITVLSTAPSSRLFPLPNLRPAESGPWSVLTTPDRLIAASRRPNNFDELRWREPDFGTSSGARGHVPQEIDCVVAGSEKRPNQESRGVHELHRGHPEPQRGGGPSHGPTAETPYYDVDNGSCVLLFYVLLTRNGDA